MAEMDEKDLAQHWAERTEAIRSRETAAIPHWYNPWVHLGFTLSACSVTAISALAGLENVTTWEWFTPLWVFLGANAFEWHIHRNGLHRKTRLLYRLYERHTPMHHSVYTHGDMVLRSAREMKLVLLPGFGIAGIIALIVPIALGLSRLVSANAGRFFLATACLYVLFYEVSHLLYHVDPDSRLGRLPGLAYLRRHHTIHHDPRLMQRWNFNVTIPLFDKILKTSSQSR